MIRVENTPKPYSTYEGPYIAPLRSNPSCKMLEPCTDIMSFRHFGSVKKSGRYWSDSGSVDVRL